ncbi:ANL family adenylate-forming protein [Candidatus Pelagibacter sp. HIMB1485]|uniref:ANL family adenylate-forming protein n=1 Tax=Candidatus Pelagibacter sp. HIMB1485 TaxID=3415415 RepID=UPI003F83CCEE
MKNFFLNKGKYLNLKDKIFLKERDGISLTFSEFNKYVDYQIKIFKKNKLNEKDPALLICTNSIRCSIIIFAAIKYGLKLVTLSRNPTNLELSNMIEEFRPKIVITLDKSLFKSKKIKIKILHIKNNLPKKVKIVKNLKISNNGYLIVKSSGTTGISKNICLSFKKLWESGENFCRIHKVPHNSVFWNYLPFSYLGGLFNLLILPATSGSTILIDKSFNSTMLLSFISTIKNFQITNIWLVPSILRSLLILHKHTKIDLKQIGLKQIFVGTAPLNFKLKKEFEEKFGLYPLENYGLSETTFISTELSNNKKSIKNGYLGKKLNQVKIKVLKEKNSKFGEIYVKTPYLFEGYYYKGNLKKINKNSFFPTGDIGLTKNNLIQIKSRKKNIIKKGGIMILPEELEDKIKKFDNLIEAVCLKKDSYLYGESFDIFIKIENTNNKIKQKLKNFKKWYYTGFSKLFWPDSFFLVKNFPTTSTGKIEKYKLNNVKFKKNEF